LTYLSSPCKLAPMKCPTPEKHAKDVPNGYIAWHEWARVKARTHACSRCPGCGLYKVWVPFADRRKQIAADYERLGSLRETGKLHNISGERVRQIIGGS
jgi:hypothetical protein